MFSLILKDMLIQKRMILFALGYAVFVLIAFQSSTFSGASYLMGSMAISYLFILGACAYDNKSEIVLNSLPLERKQIVRAKYLSVVFFAVMSILTMAVIGGVMKGLGLPFPKEYISAGDVLGTMVGVSLLTSLYLPVFFRYGYIKSRVINTIMFLVFFFAPNLLGEFIRENYDRDIIAGIFLAINSRPSWAIGLGGAALILMLMFLSLQVSIGIYHRREF